MTGWKHLGVALVCFAVACFMAAMAVWTSQMVVFAISGVGTETGTRQTTAVAFLIMTGLATLSFVVTALCVTRFAWARLRLALAEIRKNR